MTNNRMRYFLFRYMVFVTFCAIVVFLVLCSKAQAEPYLWCGATPNATKWQINLDGVLMDLPVSHVANETAWLKYDLVGIAEGVHLVEVRAGNVWGWSAWFPLAFTKGTADVLVAPYIDI